MLEELEKLAVELGQALPRIVVTCSMESLSLKRIERSAVVNSSDLLRPPPTVGNGSLVGCDAGTGRPSAKEKCRLVEKEQVSEETARSTEPSSITVPSASEQSLACIYLPEVSLSQTQTAFLRHSDRSVSPARTRVLIGQLNISRPTARRRIPQQTSTRDPMPAPARLLLSTQGTPANERYRQTFSTLLGQD
jgi:hypothetical protein